MVPAALIRPGRARLVRTLTPQRVWAYDLRCLEKVTWSSEHLSHQQSEDYKVVVQDILAQSQQLSSFAANNVGLKSELAVEAIESNTHHLELRARLYRAKFRGEKSYLGSEVVADAIYSSRVGKPEKRYKTVYKVASAVSRWSKDLSVEGDLIRLLQQWSNFQGYGQNLNVILLNDLIHLDIAENWGSLFQRCTGPYDQWQFMFFFATLSLNSDLSPQLLQTLMAFAFLPAFKTVDAPPAAYYQNYKANEIPTVDMLVPLARPACDAFDSVDDDTFDYMGARQRKEYERRRTTHEHLIASSCQSFAKHMVAQWPSEKPQVADLVDIPLLDVNVAYSLIKETWQSLVHNYQLTQFLKQLQNILATCEGKYQHHAEPARQLASRSLSLMLMVSSKRDAVGG